MWSYKGFNSKIQINDGMLILPKSSVLSFKTDVLHVSRYSFILPQHCHGKKKKMVHSDFIPSNCKPGTLLTFNSNHVVFAADKYVFQPTSSCECDYYLLSEIR